MPRPAQTALVCVAALALAGGGFWLGRRSVPAPGDAPPPGDTRGAPVATPGGATPRPVAGPDTPPPEVLAAGRETERRAALVAWVARDPHAAVAAAAAEPNRGRRERFLAAVLRAWAEHAPADAAQWALARPAGERERALADVIAGAAARPEEAVFLVRRLAEDEPGLALERGGALIAALGAREEFAAAAAFATAGAPATREAWLGAAFARWAEQAPADAARAAQQLADPALRDAALRAAIVGWAPNEPATLADFAVRLPAGETRAYALGEALRQWIDADPVAVAAWVDRFEPRPELDNAVAGIALQPFLAEQRPDVALSWAESITDAGVRANTLAQLVQSWAQRDRAAARKYVEQSRDLRAEERTDLLNLLGR